MEESPSRRAEQPVPVRHVRFEYPDDFRAAWQPLKPEFAAACNALSLGMPYGEP
jgi:predicted metal-dependent hydrolase